MNIRSFLSSTQPVSSIVLCSQRAARGSLSVMWRNELMKEGREEWAPIAPCELKHC